MTHAADKARELLDYDPNTGILRWRKKPCPSSKIKDGDIAGHVRRGGYRLIGLGGSLYYAHRVAWLITWGKWPTRQIDHINGIRDDNRLCNLREATSAENSQNIGIPSNNTSGYVGVSWNRSVAKWTAAIMLDGHQTHLGCFDSPELAAAAYARAKARLHRFSPVVRAA